ncbi:MAG TPA: HAMP domain-containing sensor histidine kinase [Candidatus Paceibacterota bacterium]
MEESENWFDSLNLKKTCSKYRVSIFHCPQFLFLIMGCAQILAILTTYKIAKIYQEPEIAALIVLAVSAMIFFIGQIIINSFERIAISSLAKSEFISIISHQLRSPMSAIKWQLDMLLSEDLKKNLSTDKFGEFLKGVYEQNERMIKSVNDLLEVNRIEDGDMVLNPESFSLQALTEQVVNQYTKEALLMNVKISVSLGSDQLVYADKIRVKRVIEYLLDNAVKYSLNGGSIEIDIEHEGKNILWKITDQGAGIPQKDQKRIFDKFFRSKNVARYKTSGSGIGLFIAKSIISLSKGKMGFFSSENKGSIFWFTLPTAGKINS